MADNGKLGTEFVGKKRNGRPYGMPGKRLCTARLQTAVRTSRAWR